MQYQTKVRQKFYFIPGVLTFAKFTMIPIRAQCEWKGTEMCRKKIDHGQSSVVYRLSSVIAALPTLPE